MPTVKDFAVKVAQGLQARALREGAKAYIDILAQIKAEDVAILIAAKRPLRDVLPRTVVTNPLAQKIIDIDPGILLKLLAEYNPGLAKVLNTPEGCAWWDMSKAR